MNYRIEKALTAAELDAVELLVRKYYDQIGIVCLTIAATRSTTISGWPGMALSRSIVLFCEICPQ